MEIKNLKNLNYPLYESAYYGFPEKELYLLIFNKLPSEFNNNLYYNEKAIDFIKEKGYVELARNINMNTNDTDIIKSEEFLFINETEKEILIIRRSSKGNDKYNLYTITLLFDITNGNYTEKQLFIELKIYERQKKRFSISLIKSDHGSLDTEGFDIEIPDINIERNYGKDFIKVHNNIVKRLNTNKDKGIVLLHGVPGTGKTNYIRYLTKCIKNKDILFIPPSMTEVLTEPSIIPFLMERKNSILIIEDGEKIISDRNTSGSSIGVSNILNLTDGIMGDCLNIQIIVTFNMERSQIDKAMIRKGRLIAEHKFDILNVEETNILLKAIGKTYISDKGLTLADIYNIDEEEFITKKSNNIGFK
jgi:hypothetical protein